MGNLFFLLHALLLESMELSQTKELSQTNF